MLFNYFKNNTKGIAEVLSNHSKNQTQGCLLIISNYFKKQSLMRSSGSFKPLQKQYKRNPRDSFKRLKKPKWATTFLWTTSKKTQWVRKILWNYLKNQTKWVRKIVSGPFKNRALKVLVIFFKLHNSETRHNRSPEIPSNEFRNKLQWSSRLFQTISKIRHKGPRDISKLLQKPNRKGSRDSFKLLQKSKWGPRFFQNTSKKTQ